MVKLLIIADDFTGALDTGVQFSAHGAVTSVITDPAFDFTKVDSSIQVLVMDAETRHLEPEQAYSVVRKAVEHALAAGVCCIYKKTDSALRGNIGAELTAVLDAAGTDRLPFIPAFPKMNRITQNGVHLIDGVPVAESVFGRDPFEPVRHSRISDILHQQSSLPVIQRHPGDPDNDSPGIQVFDAASDDDLLRIGWRLGVSGVRLCAGCAGFAAVLANLLALSGPPPQVPALEKILFIACGSVNPVTRRQLDYAEQAGFPRFRLLPEEKLLPEWLESRDCAVKVKYWYKTATQKGVCILDTNDPPGGPDAKAVAAERGLDLQQVRIRISHTLGQLMRRLLDNGLEATLMCTGGDTLLALMRAVNVTELTPVCELDTGVVLTHFTYQRKNHYIISKSGGFGEAVLLCRLAKLTGAGTMQKEDISCLRNTI